MFVSWYFSDPSELTVSSILLACRSTAAQSPDSMAWSNLSCSESSLFLEPSSDVFKRSRSYLLSSSSSAASAAASPNPPDPSPWSLLSSGGTGFGPGLDPYGTKVFSGELPLLHDETEESSWNANEFDPVESSWGGDPSFFLLPNGKVNPFQPLRFCYKPWRQH